MILRADPSSCRYGGDNRAAPDPVAEMLNLHRLGELVLDEEILVGGHSMNEVSDEHNAQIALSVKLGIFAITKFWWFTE